MLKKSRGKDTGNMGRQESALWLGRALSSSEVTMRVLLQLTDIITLQQQVIQALYEQQSSPSLTSGAQEAMDEMQAGLSNQLQERMKDLRDQLEPILQSVDESCQTLEDML